MQECFLCRPSSEVAPSDHAVHDRHFDNGLSGGWVQGYAVL